MDVKLNYSLKRYNSFGVDVSAAKFIEVHTEQELSGLIKDEFKHHPVLLLGGGSNILFTDDYRGIVVKLAFNKINIIEETSSYVIIESGAGVVWDELVHYAVGNNFTGIENLSLIPGSTGAAPIQNIGAYGQELSNTFYSAEGYYMDDGSKALFGKEQCRFGYRDSIFKGDLKDKFIISSLILKLNKKYMPETSYAPLKEELLRSGIEKPTPADVRNIVAAIRRKKLPDPAQLGNAGSFFKNPIVDIPVFDELKKQFPDIKGYASGSKIKLYAGWLIEKCGWKGVREGRVGSHSEQSLVLVNYGGASGKEILDFAVKIKESVFTNFGIQLQEEVNII